MTLPHFRLWHFSDVASGRSNVCSWGNSGRGPGAIRLLLMTPIADLLSDFGECRPITHGRHTPDPLRGPLVTRFGHFPQSPAELDSAGRLRASMGVRRSGTNADDRLPHASLGRVEGGDGIVEGRDVADVRPQSSVPHPLDDLTQLGTIGLDNEVDRQAVGGPRLGRPDDGHQCSSGSNQACGPLPDVAADDIENQIDPADVFQGVVVEVDELLRAEVERLLTVGGASGTDDVGAGLTCELGYHRTDCAGRAVHEYALPRLKTAMLEQSLPRSQARDRYARAHREVDVARQRR